MKKQEIKFIFQIVIYMLLSVFAYYSCEMEYQKQLLIYLLILLNLIFSINVPQIIILLNSVCLVLLFAGGARCWPITTIGIYIILLISTAIPLCFNRMKIILDKKFEKEHVKLVETEKNLERQLVDKFRNRSNLENQIDKINQIYVLGKELVEYMDTNSVLEHLQNILLKRQGIISVNIFSWTKNKWEGASFSQDVHKEAWLKFLNDNKAYSIDKRVRKFLTPSWIESDAAVVLWPIHLEKELVAAIILTVTNDTVPRYINEGEIFIPQIALSLKRTQLFAEVQERSRSDGLTGLYLRRYFMERLNTEIQRARRYGTYFSIILADIDFFKSINDTYGHLTGDNVLAISTKILLNCLRPGDLAGRYGGEEFIAMLPMTTLEEAVKIGNCINTSIAKNIFTVEEMNFKITISIGVSQYPGDGKTAEDLISSADKALYWVKTNGRNGVKDTFFLPGI